MISGQIRAPAPPTGAEAAAEAANAGIYTPGQVSTDIPSAPPLDEASLDPAVPAQAVSAALPIFAEALDAMKNGVAGVGPSFNELADAEAAILTKISRSRKKCGQIQKR